MNWRDKINDFVDSGWFLVALFVVCFGGSAAVIIAGWC
jgi:hypothetical protein